MKTSLKDFPKIESYYIDPRIIKWKEDFEASLLSTCRLCKEDWHESEVCFTPEDVVMELCPKCYIKEILGDEDD